MIKKELLEILCCPETHSALTVAEAELVAEMNRKITAGQLTNRAGEIINEPINGGLLRADGKIVYLVRNDIPNLLIDQGTPIPQG